MMIKKIFIIAIVSVIVIFIIVSVWGIPFITAPLLYKSSGYCPQVIVHARNTLTRQTTVFSDTCDIPWGWEPIFPSEIQ